MVVLPTVDLFPVTSIAFSRSANRYIVLLVISLCVPFTSYLSIYLWSHFRNKPSLANLLALHGIIQAFRG
jgi:hypothetical protein